MAPFPIISRQAAPAPPNANGDDWNWRKNAKDEDLVLESWSQGFVVGALLLMGCITIANMRRGVLLHKLILAEQLMALTHGTFCFFDFSGYGWYLSSTAALLYLSYILHNVVSWMKISGFFHGKSTIFESGFVKWTTRIYWSTLILTVPPILFQISDNFRFFNGYGGWYTRVRPYEPLMRDPWWVFCSGILFYVISKSYGMGVVMIIKKSPRFGILFAAIILALIFTSLDIAASIVSFIGTTDGINPFWKLALVFKCLTDAILLDDFKTELKRLGLKRIKRDEKRRESTALTLDVNDRYDSDEEARMNFSRGTVNGDTLNAYRHSVSNGRPKGTNDGGEDEQVEFMQALTSHQSRLSSDRESRRGSSIRPQVGRGGLPATRLPKLFNAIKPGKKRKESAEVETEKSRNESIWTLPDEETESETKRSKRKARDDDQIAPDEVRLEDDSLEEARRMNERTIAELTRRKNSQAGTSRSPGAVSRAQRQSKSNSSKNFWDGIDDMDDDLNDGEDDGGPSSSHQR